MVTRPLRLAALTLAALLPALLLTAPAHAIPIGQSAAQCLEGGAVADLDNDGVDDTCEYALAHEFRPELVFYDTERFEGRYSTWAVRRNTSASAVIFYALGYYSDGGRFGIGALEGHKGDSEFIVVKVEDRGVDDWVMTEATLSAHYLAWWTDRTRAYDASAFEFVGGRPVVHVAAQKHGNFPTRASCDDGGFKGVFGLTDGCTFEAFREEVEVLPGRNLGSPSHPVLANPVTYSWDGDAELEVETFWDRGIPFCGWHYTAAEHFAANDCAPGVNAYADQLDEHGFFEGPYTCTGCTEAEQRFPTVTVTPSPIRLDEDCAYQGGINLPPLTEVTLVFDDPTAGVQSRENRVTTDAQGRFDWSFGLGAGCSGAAMARATAYLDRVDPFRRGFVGRPASYWVEYWADGVKQSNVVSYTIDYLGTCVPACAGRTCGSDGCGGVCGMCVGGDRCASGACVAPSGGPTTLSGTISGAETWTLAQSPIVTTGDITITGTLTIEAGVVVRLGSADDIRVTTGSLIAVGTTIAPIVFTADGPTVPRSWGGVSVAATAGAVTIRHASFRYGGDTAFGGVGKPIEVHGSATGVDIADIEFVNNRVNGIGLITGTYNTSLRLNVVGVPYWVSSDITVATGVTMTVDPGVIVKFETTVADILVNGRLVADGTELQPIIFTSGRDDRFGLGTSKDTNNDGATVPGPGSWGGIQLDAPGSGAASVLDFVVINFGGYLNSNAVSFPVLIDGRVQPNITNLTLASNRINGLGLSTSTYSSNTRLNVVGVPYWVSGDLTVGAGTTMTVDAGVVIKFEGTTNDLNVDGALVALGTASRPVVFTAGRDDAHGGDTNADGATSPTPASWGGIALNYLANQPTTVLDHVLVAYGGSTALYAARFPMVLDGRVSPVISHLSLRDNRVNGIALNSGTYNADVRLNVLGVPYWIDSDLTIGASATMTVDPGVVIKFEGATDDLFVDGAIVANGTALAPIVFTAARDDRFDGDTNGDGETAPTRGSWGGIVLANTANPQTSVLDNVLIAYGGSNALYATPYPIQVDGRITPTITSTLLLNNRVDGINLKSSTTYSANVRLNVVDLPYWIDSDLNIAAGATMTVDPGVVVKFQGATDDLIVEGRLVADGTPERPIVFTAARDDAHGGDTNVDGATAPSPSSWGGIHLDYTTVASTSSLRNVEVLYGGSSALYAASYPIRLDLRQNPTVSGLTLDHNRVNAIGVDTTTYTQNVTLDLTDVTYWADGDLSMAAGTLLTVNAGVLVKFGGVYSDVAVHGRLMLNGTAQAPVVFTAGADDSRGGDANANGPSSAAPGSWGGVLFYNDSVGSRLSHAVIAFGGSNFANATSALTISGTDLGVEAVDFVSNDDAVYVGSGGNVDLGGGATGSLGGNRFSGHVPGSGNWAVYNASTNLIYALSNVWSGYTAAADIEGLLYDVADNANVGDIVWNSPPVALAQAVTTAEDSPRSIALTGTDPDGTALTFQVVGAPSSGTLSGAAPNLTFTPARDFFGVATFTFRVSDGTSWSAPATVTVTVTPVNDAPFADSFSISTLEDTPRSVTLTGLDLEGDPLTFRITRAPTFGQLVGQPPTLTYVPALNSNVLDTFSYVAHDGQLDSDPATVTVEVVAVNDPPTLTPVAARSSAEGAVVTLAMVAQDVDGDPLTWQATGLPPGLSIHATTGVISGTVSATASTGSPYAVRVTVRDAVAQASIDFTWTITDTNRPPTVTLPAPQTVNEGAFVTFTPTLADPDGDALTVSWDLDDDGQCDDATSPTASITAADGPATLRVTVCVHDGSVEVRAATTVTVLNVAPTFGTITVGAFAAGVAGTVEVVVNDPAGDLDAPDLSWDWGDGTPILTGRARIATHTYAAPGPYTLQITSNDRDGGITVTTAPITVDNPAPVITALIIPPTVAEGQPATFRVQATDNDPTGLRYTWALNASPPVATGADPTWTTTFPDDGVATLTVTVTDAGGLRAVQTATVTVLNLPPTITSLTAPAEVAEGTSVTLIAAATDVLADPLTFLWRLAGVDAPGGVDVTTATFRLPDDGVYVAELIVRDDDGGESTATRTITAFNVPPTVEFAGPSSAGPGALLPFLATITDPGADTFSLRWDFGDGTDPLTTPLTEVEHAFVTEGTYTITVTVTDDDGGAGAATMEVVINAGAPLIETFELPATAREGDPVTASATATDPNGLTLTWTWDFGDGSPSVEGASPQRHTWLDDGVFTVALTVTNNEAVATTARRTIIVTNGAPAIASVDVGVFTAGEPAGIYALVSDPAGARDPLTFDWDFGDGDTLSGEGLTEVSHIYTQPGVYTVRLTVTDDGGATTSTTALVTVAPATTPTATLNGPDDAEEGDTVAFAATLAPAATGPLSFAWDFGDGTPTVTTSEPYTAHLFPDDGAFTVSLVITDAAGATHRATHLLTVTNAPPRFVSTPPTTALWGETYTYLVETTDPGADPLTLELEAAPSGMDLLVTPADTRLAWRMTAAHYHASPTVEVRLRVCDDADACATQPWQLALSFVDADADGSPDPCETLYGLDPTDPADGPTDLDRDGLSNRDECLLGTRPDAFNGPTAPTLLAPIDAARIPTPTPTLLVTNATDPDGDALRYTFRLYADPDLTDPIATLDDIAETPDTTSVDLSAEGVELAEDTSYYWTALASDPHTPGPTSEVGHFFVDQQNSPPTVPRLLAPTGSASSPTPTLELDPSTDPEHDPITYLFRLSTPDAPDAPLLDLETAEPHLLTDPLTPGRTYLWTAAARDSLGATSAFAAPPLTFTVDPTNTLPLAPELLSPAPAEVVRDLPLTLTWRAPLDADADPLTYDVQLASDPTFNTLLVDQTDLPSTPDPTQHLTVTDPLPDGPTHARVRAHDPYGAGPFATVAFTLNAVNDPPTVPRPVAPTHGITVAPTDLELTFLNATDPDGDAVLYTVELARERDAEPFRTLPGVPEDPTGTTTVYVSDLPTDVEVVFWRVTAVDEAGAAGQPSEWAEFAVFRDVPAAQPPGCGCETPGRGAGSGGLGWWIVVVVGVGWGLGRRRSLRGVLRALHP